MKIAIDARWIFPQASGIGIHTRQLIRGLGDCKPAGHEWLLLFEDAARADRVRAECGVDWPVELLPYGLFSLRNQLQLPGLLRRRGVDLLHSTNYMMPLRAAGVKRVVTIHDLIPMRFRGHAPRSKKSRLYPVYQHLMLQIGRRADHIIAVSESSRADVCDLLRLRDPNKVSVVYNGIDPRYCPDPAVPKEEPPEILYVGRLDPYKNVVGLIEAVAALTVPCRLRIIGPPDPRYPEAGRRAVELGVAVDWSGAVSEDELLTAYRRAAVLVLASEYEGFGLPVAEAMACGTPVICGNRSSLPEIAGDAAQLVTPGDVPELNRALTRVLTEPECAARLRAAGPAQAARFTIANMARETLRVYEQL